MRELFKLRVPRNRYLLVQVPGADLAQAPVHFLDLLDHILADDHRDHFKQQQMHCKQAAQQISQCPVSSHINLAVRDKRENHNIVHFLDNSHAGIAVDHHIADTIGYKFFISRTEVGQSTDFHGSLAGYQNLILLGDRDESGAADTQILFNDRISRGIDLTQDFVCFRLQERAGMLLILLGKQIVQEKQHQKERRDNEQKQPFSESLLQRLVVNHLFAPAQSVSVRFIRYISS